jgi:hypothetical protein
MSANTPPPLPIFQPPIQFVKFQGEHIGFHNAEHDRIRLEIAQKQAEAWMNQNPQFEIVTINSSFGDHIAIVTVWYR